MRLLSIVLLSLAALAACATPQSRIRRHQADFNDYPAEVQEKIKKGKADMGFSSTQVEMALGKPDRVYTRKTAGASQEVWAYGGTRRPRLSLGFGMATGGYSSIGTGMDMGTGFDYPEDRIRVIFEKDQVLSIETREK